MGVYNRIHACTSSTRNATVERQKKSDVPPSTSVESGGYFQEFSRLPMRSISYWEGNGEFSVKRNITNTTINRVKQWQMLSSIHNEGDASGTVHQWQCLPNTPNYRCMASNVGGRLSFN